MTPIYTLLDNLPKDGVTVRALKALDFVSPGTWNNTVGFYPTIQLATGESDQDTLQRIANRMDELFNDNSQGYQRALWLYQTVDSTDKALGAAALANTVGQQISWLGFLNRITPDAEKTQTIDLVMKIAAECAAFCYVNGIPGDSVGDFVQALGAYEGDNLIRMSAIIAFDGLIPLGPEFIQRVSSYAGSFTGADLQSNSTFKAISQAIPGGSPDGQASYLGTMFGSVSQWMGGFMPSVGLNLQNVLSNLSQHMEVHEDKLQYLAGFLDMSTNYMEHTGTQSLGRSLASRAVGEI